MKRILLAGLFGLLAVPAWAAPPNQALVVATCGTISPLFLAGRDAPLTVDVNGLNCSTATLSGSVTANTTATATASAPSYLEGIADPFSQDLSGHLRVTGLGGSFPITAASGSIASGAVASGAVASGAYVAGSLADGSVVTLGAKTDAKSTATDATSITVMQVLKEMSFMLQTPAALPSNQSVNIAQVNGGTVATGSGAMNAQTLRTALATDSPGIITTGTAGSASSQVLTIQGVTSMTPILANPGTAANWGVVATGAAPPANAVQVGAVASGATGGLTAGLKTCDLHAKYDASDNGNITLVTGVSSRKIYICGYILANGGTATNLSLTEGSDANCATNNAGLTPVYQILANQSVGVMSPFWAGLAVSTNAYFVCIKSSAGNAHQGEIWYTIQ